MIKKIHSSLFALAFVFVLVSTAEPQTITALVRGTVRDAQGEVVPGASLTASSPALAGRTLAAVSGQNGAYSITDLPPGTYQIQVELQGFQTQVLTGIELTIRREALLDITLQVAAVEESITVVAQPTT